VSQTSVKNSVCDIAGYVVPVLQNGALKWKKKLTGVRHDKARPHASGAVSEILEKYGWQVLPHPLYSPDMSPPEFHLFPKLKKPLREKRFRSIEEVSNEVTRVIRRINNEGVLTGIQDLPKSRTAVIKHNGEYIEDL
jgi:histone-lysine N-methyltransferase SETMAR